MDYVKAKINKTQQNSTCMLCSDVDEKNHNYLGLTRDLKKAMEHEGDGDCNRFGFFV